ncbi:MAG: chorismate-binding protein [Phycisphaerales bacterium]
MASLTRDELIGLVGRERAAGRTRTLAVPVGVRLLADQLTPVLAYRRLVSPDERTAPSFLLESVEGGERQGRHSILGSRPMLEVVTTQGRSEITWHGPSVVETPTDSGDPFEILRGVAGSLTLVVPEHAVERGLLPSCFLGGWVGNAAYDTVRYAEPGKLGWDGAPTDDRGLPDLQFGFYDGVVVFDHVAKVVHVVQLAFIGAGDDPGKVYDQVVGTLAARCAEIERHSKPLPSGRMDREAAGDAAPMASNTTRQEHASMVARALEYIRAGDIFQVVIGQRFERVSAADPFDVYRALRAVNPSPYMVYLQGRGQILVASSPEILCRVRREGDGRLVVTNRPLAGTRKRGATPEEDAALEIELLADPKERAEHIMLVDLGRNDVGRVAEPGSIELASVMTVERYSHVMHISSTVTGRVRTGLDCWDALRAARCPSARSRGRPRSARCRSSTSWRRCGAGRMAGAWAGSGSTGRWTLLSPCARSSSRPRCERTRPGRITSRRPAGSSRTRSRRRSIRRRSTRRPGPRDRRRGAGIRQRLKLIHLPRRSRRATERRSPI